MEFHIKEFQAVVNNFKQKQDPIIRKQEEMLNDAAGRQSGVLETFEEQPEFRIVTVAVTVVH